MENQLLETLNLSPIGLFRILFALMIAILFLQSGIDKIVNYQGEKSFYIEHFKDSILAGSVGLLMPVITLFEVAAGILTAIGLVLFMVNGSTTVACLGTLLATLAIIQLFLGQRVAKDYAGAAVLVPYFFLTVGGVYLFAIG